MATMQKPQAQIIMLPSANEALLEQREARQEAIETCLNNIGAIVTLLHETVEGERFMSARAWLAEQLDKNFGVLDRQLSVQ
jgi:hypothetical protein